MNNKFFINFKKVVVVLAIIVLCSTNAVYGFTIGGRFQANQMEQTNIIMTFFNKIFKIFGGFGQTEYKIEDLLRDLKKIEAEGMENLKLEDITSLINKLPQSKEKVQLLGTVNSYSQLSKSGNSGLNLGSLVKVLINLLSSLVDGVIGLIGSDGIAVNAIDINITADTAEQFAGEEYGVKLHANIYKNEQKTNKWALVIHPFMMSGETIANAVGRYYYNKGYNILAIDLRGFGDSEGSVALGLLESLDTYDWLVKMNQDKTTFGEIDHIIVHGTSLGAATTNFLSGIDQFMANGSKAINLKSLKELKVRALVEDCGYKDMEQFADKSFIMSLGIGLNEDNFEYYSNAINSLKYCQLPMLIIHGDADTMVDYNNNAPVIRDTVNSSTRGGSAQLVTIRGGGHAVIIMGNNDTYSNAVNNFIDTYGRTSNTPFSDYINYRNW